MVESKKAPDAVTSKGQPKCVEAIDKPHIADGAAPGKQPVKTGEKQARQHKSALPGFTSPPVWELQKHDGRLVAGEREYKGRQFFELRLWAGEHGDKATSKGVTMPLESVDELARALSAYAGQRALNSPENGSQD